MLLRDGEVSPIASQMLVHTAGQERFSASSSSAAAAVPKSTSGTLITSTKAAAPLSRKYADLLKERNIEWDVSISAILELDNRVHLLSDLIEFI